MANVEHTLLRGDGINLPAPPLQHGMRPLAPARWLRAPRFEVKLPVHSPQALVGGDAASGRAMMRGEFAMTGATVISAPAMLFSVPAPSSAWRDALLSLAWLPDLAATPQQLSGLTARAAVNAWKQQALRDLTTPQAARALITLTGHAEFMLQGAGGDFHAAFKDLIARLCRRMQPGFIENAETGLLKAIAMSHAAVAFQFAKPIRDKALAHLTKLIDRVVLPDGGHVSRGPQRLVQLALDLIPLQRALRALHLAVPAALNAALERMLPMVRLMSHGDGALSSLQDGGHASPAAVQAVLAADASCGRPLALAPYAGFGRLAYHDGVLLADTGSNGPCNSPLAFEFSHAGQRLIVSCGRPADGRHGWCKALSSPAAHSGWDMPFDLASLTPSLKAETLSSPQGGLLQASLLVRGWRRSCRHERRLFLSATGSDLRGEDHVRMEGAGAEPCILRFHLHPALKAEASPHPNCIILNLPCGASWTFSQAGGTISLEDSVYCEAGAGPLPAKQIVLRSLQASGIDIQWSLRRMQAKSASSKALA